MFVAAQQPKGRCVWGMRLGSRSCRNPLKMKNAHLDALGNSQNNPGTRWNLAVQLPRVRNLPRDFQATVRNKLGAKFSRAKKPQCEIPPPCINSKTSQDEKSPLPSSDAKCRPFPMPAWNAAHVLNALVLARGGQAFNWGGGGSIQPSSWTLPPQKGSIDSPPKTLPRLTPRRRR